MSQMISLRSLVVGLLFGVAAKAARIQKARRGQAKAQPQDPGSNAELFEEVRQQVDSQPRVILNPDNFPKCHLSESECRIQDMTEATLVYTDSDTSLCWNGEPFAFLVHPGRTDKLLYYFPNGGACWEFPFYLPGAASVCLPNMLLGLTVTGYGMGITDYGRSENDFRDYTFVSPPYCTGGGHVANTTVEGVFKTNYQYDYNNNEFTRSWALKNLDQTLESFVIMGSSAGAIGTMAWAHFLLSTFQYRKATVVVDSYMGVFPEGSQGPTIQKFEVCNLQLFANFKEACEAGTANIQDVFDYAIEQHPDVAFAVIQPKWDLVQRAFFGVIALTYLDLDLYLSPAAFYQTTNAMLQRYTRHPNFVNYYVDGGFHTFLWHPGYYWATVKGEFGIGGDGGKPTVVQWTNALVDHQPVQSLCNGPLEPNGGNSWLFNNTRYCDEKLYPKTLRLTPPAPSPTQPPHDCPIYCFVCLLSACSGCCK